MSHTVQWDANRFERTARVTTWSIAAYNATGRQIHSTSRLETADVVRTEYRRLNASAKRVEITEFVIDVTERFISFGDLPAPGQPAERPELPDGASHAVRAFRLTSGPRILPTGDAVRRYCAWLTDQNRAPSGERELLEVTLIHHVRRAELADLPASGMI